MTRFGYFRAGVSSINGETGDITLNLQRVQQQVRYFSVSAVDEQNKAINLPILPTAPEQVQVDVLNGGGALYYQLDFEVAGTQVSWANGRYDGVIGEGDSIRVRWTSDAATQQQVVRYYTLESINRITKSIQLPSVPGEPERVVVDVMNGGGTLVYGLDFTIIGQTLSWASGRYEELLIEDDELRVAYY